MKTAERLTEDLRTALAAEHVAVEDESARHRGHAGAMDGGHYDAVIVSAKPPWARLIGQPEAPFTWVARASRPLRALSVKRSS